MLEDMPNKSLINFKEHLGGIPSNRYTYIKAVSLTSGLRSLKAKALAG
jgi:hypothetical protein